MLGFVVWPGFVVLLCASGGLGFGRGWVGGAQSFRAQVGLFGSGWSFLGVWLGAGWACCHRFHFFGCFYGICDTIGREPVTDSIFFAVFMESATNPRSTVVCNVGCCRKFHFFRRFYGICDSRDENISSSIGCAYQTAGNAARRLGKPAHTPGNQLKPPESPEKPADPPQNIRQI